ncbi:MAG: hypothetical protein ACI9X0_002951, partial [Kiritimatiellia bacterium]
RVEAIGQLAFRLFVESGVPECSGVGQKDESDPASSVYGMVVGRLHEINSKAFPSRD